MVVLLTGATGFIGRHLLEALLAAGHEVVGAVRRAHLKNPVRPRVRYVEADFAADFDPAVWMARLAGVDAAINAVGILRERGRQTFEGIHVRAPQALFAACESAGVRRVIQISALGADERAISPYHLSKKRADDFLAALPLDWTVAQPSVVFGPGGASARMFTSLARLPLIPIPGQGGQRMQPVHVEDLAQAIVALIQTGQEWRCRVPIVGPEPLTYREFLARLRAALGYGKARFLPIPMSLMQFGARVAAWAPASPLDPDTLAMLVRGTTGDVTMMRRLLGRDPRPVEAFVR